MDERLEGLIGGVAAAATPVALAILIAAAAMRLPGPASLVASVLLLKISFSAAALERAVLGASGEPLEPSRRLTGHLVSRDTSQMGPGHLASAQLETLSENTTDSLFSPLLYFALLGLPGALAYRALDTADSTVGYPGRGLEGRVVAAAEDAASLLPSYLVLVPVAIGAAFTEGPGATWKGLAAARGSGGKRSGFNGKVIAFYAGALGVTLEKPGGYSMGYGELPGTEDVRRGIRLFRASVVATAVLLTASIYVTGLPF